MAEIDQPEQAQDGPVCEWAQGTEPCCQYAFLDFFNLSISAAHLESECLFGSDASDYYSINCGRLSRHLDYPHLYGLISWMYLVACRTRTSQAVRFR